MQRALNFQVICDDDALENKLTPATVRVFVAFNPRLPLVETPSLMARVAREFDTVLTGVFGPHSCTVILTPEQRLEEEAERAALDDPREIRRDGAEPPEDATDEPLVRLA